MLGLGVIRYAILEEQESRHGLTLLGKWGEARPSAYSDAASDHFPVLPLFGRYPAEVRDPKSETKSTQSPGSPELNET